jgi:hypothetical protein
MSLLQGCWQCRLPAFPLRFPTVIILTLTENVDEVKTRAMAEPRERPLYSICPTIKMRDSSPVSF